MNYKRIYNELISNRKQNLVEGYGESHHIIPKCLNGTDEKENIVKLTAREHFIAHALLCKIYPKENKLLFAFNCMYNGWGKKQNLKRDYKINSKLYEMLRKRLANLISEQNKGRKLTEVQKQKLSQSLKETYASGKYKPTARYGKDNGMYGKERPQYVRDAVAKANKERIWSEESKQKLSKSVSGSNNKWFGKHITKDMKCKEVAHKCLRVLQVYNSNDIDPAIWNENSRKAFTSKTNPVCGMRSIIKRFGNFDNMINFINETYGTQYKVIYPDDYSVLIQKMRFDKVSDANKTLVFNSFVKLLPIFSELYGNSKEVDKFIKFVEKTLDITKSHLNLKEVYRGGTKKKIVKIEDLWFYESSEG